MRISVVIPTYNREGDLKKCLNSIISQIIPPNELLLIDDGNLPKDFIAYFKENFKKKSIDFNYIKKNNPGLAESKNIGAKKSRGEVVLFLDDDVVLENNYLKKMNEVWEQYKNENKLAGISGLATNVRKVSFFEKIFNRVFFLHKEGWKILPWGFQTWDYSLNKEDKADWIPGYNSSFNRKIFDSYQFKSLQKGRTALEDIEFCWNLKRSGYYFLITPFLKLEHNESKTGREKAFVSGKKEGFNRCFIFSAYADKNILNYIKFFISSMGSVSRKWGAAIIDYNNFFIHSIYSLGIVCGVFDYLWKK